MNGLAAAELCLYRVDMLYIVVHPDPLARPPLALPLLRTLKLRCGPAELGGALADLSSSFAFFSSAARARFFNTPGALATVLMSLRSPTATATSPSMLIISDNARLTAAPSNAAVWGEENGFVPPPFREEDIDEGCVGWGDARSAQ